VNENDFSSLVRGWATSALEQNPELNLDGLVRALPGVYPSDLVRILGDQWGRLLRRSNPGADSLRPSSEDGFPVPHPLDYDWRFTQETRVLLSKMVMALLPQKGSVTLLGAPTLFEHLVKLRTDAINNWPRDLFEKNDIARCNTLIRRTSDRRKPRFDSLSAI
jgi:hypothetical protein